MKETTKVAGVVIFGVLMSLGMPFLTNINIEIMVQSKIHSFLPEPLFSEVTESKCW